MDIKRSGAQPSGKGPAESFSGTVRIDPLFQSPEPARALGVWCPPREKHWHGATATTAMTHIAIVERLEGKAVDWMEKVTDAHYRAGSSTE